MLGELFFCMVEVVGVFNVCIWIEVIDVGGLVWCYWLDFEFGCKY